MGCNTTQHYTIVTKKSKLLLWNKYKLREVITSEDELLIRQVKLTDNYYTFITRSKLPFCNEEEPENCYLYIYSKKYLHGRK